MKEVLTKDFWQGVKKTFYEAMEPEPVKDDAEQVDESSSASPEKQ